MSIAATNLGFELALLIIRTAIKNGEVTPEDVQKRITETEQAADDAEDRVARRADGDA